MYIKGNNMGKAEVVKFRRKGPRNEIRIAIYFPHIYCVLHNVQPFILEIYEPYYECYPI